MDIFKKFTFDAGHMLPNVPIGHRCGAYHGHTYTVFIHITGSVNKQSGWVIDFGDIKTVFKPILIQLDHHYLNEIEGLENPTGENLCFWIWNKVKPELPGLSKIVVWETPNAGCIYKGE